MSQIELLTETKMGLHRDGGKWNLPDEVVEDRRRGVLGVSFSGGFPGMSSRSSDP